VTSDQFILYSILYVNLGQKLHEKKRQVKSDTAKNDRGKKRLIHFALNSQIGLCQLSN